MALLWKVDLNCTDCS